MLDDIMLFIKLVVADSFRTLKLYCNSEYTQTYGIPNIVKLIYHCLGYSGI